MGNTEHSWGELGIAIPQIILPKTDVDWKAWAVVACDQYSSEPEYWQQTEEICKDKASTLHMVLPEVYLDSPQEEARIQSAKSNMKEYVANGLLRTLEPGAMLVERRSNGRTRNGVVLSVDLECYCFEPDSKSLIRASEGTIIERIPPRLRMRMDAELELPHILLLIDDPEGEAIEPLVRLRNEESKFECIYDFDLMMNGGHVRGDFIPENDLGAFRDALGTILDKSKSRYDAPLLFVVGDGNHSLATALTHWNELKNKLEKEELASHPARYALVEIQNIHDSGIQFEAIHRVLFGLPEGGKERVEELIEKYKYSHSLKLAALQNALDAYLAEEQGASIDYIHGEESARKLGNCENRMSFLLESMKKDELFDIIAKDGLLPRKAFSMGGADEKRFYIEARKITR